MSLPRLRHSTLLGCALSPWHWATLLLLATPSSLRAWCWDFGAVEEHVTTPLPGGLAAYAGSGRALRRSIAAGSSLADLRHHAALRHEHRKKRAAELRSRSNRSHLSSCRDPDKDSIKQSPWQENLILMDCLGQGGFGQVWSACFKRCSVKESDEDLCMAMKLLVRKRKISSSRFLSQIGREKACLSVFNGGPFIQSYGFSAGGHNDDEDDSGLAYFLMEQAAGGDASRIGALFRIENGGLSRGGNTLHRGNVAVLFYDLVDGLRHLHHQGVVHRDVKAANLFLTSPCDSRNEQCRGKLSDFGLACTLDYNSNRILTRSLQNCDDITGGGTRSWWSPEHDSKSSPSTKLDIWGAGLTLYHLTFGTWPGNYVRDRGKKQLIQSIRKFRIEKDENFKLLGKRAEHLGPLLGSYYSMLGEVLSATLEPDADQRPDAKTLLEYAKRLCAVCGADPLAPSRSESSAHDVLQCVEESSPGTSMQSSSSNS